MERSQRICGSNSGCVNVYLSLLAIWTASAALIQYKLNGYVRDLFFGSPTRKYVSRAFCHRPLCRIARARFGYGLPRPLQSLPPSVFGMLKHLGFRDGPSVLQESKKKIVVTGERPTTEWRLSA